MPIVRDRRGSTLIEVMITAVILSAAAAAMCSVVVASLRGWSSGSSSEAATSQVAIALQKLSNEIRDGRNASVSNGVLTITFPTRVTDVLTGQTTYDMSSDDPNPRLYYVSNGDLVRSYLGSVTTVARGISQATFTVSGGGGSVEIVLRGSQQIGTSSSYHDERCWVALRNHRS